MKPFRLTFAAGVAALVALALGLRFLGLGEKALNEDEAALLMQALGIRSGSLDPPVPVRATAFWLWVTGDTSNFTLRFLPALLGGLALWPLACAARALAGGRVAVFVGLLYAINPFALRLSQTGRPYGFLLFSLALLWLAYLSALRRNDGRSWALYGAAVALACLSHLTAVPLVGALALAGLWLDRRGNRLLPLAAAAAGCLPAGVWLLGRLSAAHHTLEFIPLLSPLEYGQTAAFALLGLYRKVGPFWLAWPPLLLAGVGLGRLARERRDLALRLGLAIAVCGIVTYATLGWKATWGIGWTRYLVTVLHPALFLLALGAAAFPLRPLAPAAALVAAGIFATGAVGILRDWRDKGRFSYEVATRRWLKRHSPDGVLAVGRDSVRLTHSLARFVPPSYSLFAYHPRRGLYRMVRGTSPRGDGVILKKRAGAPMPEGKLLLVTSSPRRLNCKTALPGSREIAIGPVTALCLVGPGEPG